MHPDSVRTAADPKFRYADTSGVALPLANADVLRKFTPFTIFNVYPTQRRYWKISRAQALPFRQYPPGANLKRCLVCGWADISNFVRL